MGNERQIYAGELRLLTKRTERNGGTLLTATTGRKEKTRWGGEGEWAAKRTQRNALGRATVETGRRFYAQKNFRRLERDKGSKKKPFITPIQAQKQGWTEPSQGPQEWKGGEKRGGNCERVVEPTGEGRTERKGGNRRHIGGEKATNPLSSEILGNVGKVSKGRCKPCKLKGDLKSTS